MEMDRSNISDELLASFMEGNASLSESEMIIAESRLDFSLREIMSIAAPDCDVLPMLAESAADGDDCLCNVRCEQYVLQKFGITAGEDELTAKAQGANWLKEGGTPLFRIGSLCADYGLSVTRRYGASLSELEEALEQGYEVIVAVDGGEIDGDLDYELIEDSLLGRIPDHSMVVLSVGNEVVCYNPFYGEIPQMVPEDRFIDAWDDSDNYMVMITSKEDVAKSYKPAPLDLSDVELPESLTELTEAIAENTHEVWSQNRMAEGWTYGPARNDKLKKHPDLLPYSDLTEGEKEYDRATAMNAIKLIVKLGYKIEKV